MCADAMYQNAANIAVVLQSTQADARGRAERIATKLNVAVQSQEPDDRLRLVVTDDRIELRGGSLAVWVDFASLDVRPPGASRSLSRRQPLAKAMGKHARTIVDATAGMGQDAFLLACMGYNVTAIERSPVIAALLEDGLQRAEDDPPLNRAMGGRLQLIEGDARQVLARLDPPDVVYLDPMFPPKRRESALPKKEIQLLRQVVGDDPDAGELFEAARLATQQRIVVKRPTYAPPLVPNPTASLEGKLARYDVYVR